MTKKLNYDEVVNCYPTKALEKFRIIEKLVYEAAKSNGISFTDTIVKDVKWGQPAFIPPKKLGTMIRCAWSQKNPQSISIFFLCKTKMISIIKDIYANDLQIIGNREIRFSIDENLPLDIIRHCLEIALRYYDR